MPGRRLSWADEPISTGVDIALAETPGVAVLTIAGNLDVYTVPALLARAEPLVDGDRDVVVDLSDVAVLDSAGLGGLLSLRNRLSERGRRLGIACGRLRNIIGIAGLAPAFVLGDDLPAVLVRLGRMPDAGDAT